RARQETHSPVRRLAAGRVRVVGHVLRGAVQAGPYRPREDPGSEAVAGRAGGAQEVRRRSEGNHGGGEAMTTSVRDLQERGLGATQRRDAWWVAPALTAPLQDGVHAGVLRLLPRVEGRPSYVL